MAVRKRIRRKLRRRAPAVRRPSGLTQADRNTSSDLLVGGAMDPAEKAAEKMAGHALAGQGCAIAGSASVGGAGSGALHRQCAACADKSEEGEVKRAAVASPVIAPGASSTPAPKSAASAVSSMGSGRRMNQAERAFYEPRFGRNFSDVRFHEGPAANKASRVLGARAFTKGADVAFAQGELNQRTMAHELAHVVQDGGATTRRSSVLRRDLADAPASPDAEPEALTERQRASALRYNNRRFEDPFTVKIARDVMGIAPTPAVIDEAFTDAVLRWQAQHGLDQDGKLGPGTTRTLVTELLAEGESRLARLLRSDNYVRVHDVIPITRIPMASPPLTGHRFIWDVRFTTSLRNGFIVQRIDNVWNENPNAGIAPAVVTPRYWEAWSVDAGGAVTPANGTVNDMWRRPFRVGTRGNWRMQGTLFTVLNIPAAFGAGNVPNAGILQSTAALSHRQEDRLGLPEGFTTIKHDENARTVSGSWNGQGLPATWFNN